MFTLDQIHEAFYKVKSGADFPKYVQDLLEIGVTHYDNYVSDGRTIYFGLESYELSDAPKYPPMSINTVSSSEKLSKAIRIHQLGETDYPTFCIQAAEAGVEKWTTNGIARNVSYFDSEGKLLLLEPF